MSAPQLYTVTEVADMIGKKPRWVADQARCPIPFVKVGNTKMFEESHIRAFIRANTVTPNPDRLITSREARRLGVAS